MNNNIVYFSVVQVREATFLIASYLQSYEGQRPNTELFNTH